MSREVKFRAKVLNTNNWIYRQPFHIRGTWYMYNQLWDMVPIEHKTIGQYTGLKDKNSVEIYEGDIVTFIGDSSSRDRVIEYKSEEASFVARALENTEYIEPAYLNDLDFEVKGNIYEHPHLLEVSS